MHVHIQYENTQNATNGHFWVIEGESIYIFQIINLPYIWSFAHILFLSFVT